MTNTRTKQKERTLYIILAAALAARLLLALVTEGYTYVRLLWQDKLASRRSTAFYPMPIVCGLPARPTHPLVARAGRPWCARRSN